uniref:Putative tick kunitz 1 n=1 Tax=Amblyomma americanum TaxID=6943 RepID=A0A0C9RXF1_AMBAM
MQLLTIFALLCVLGSTLSDVKRRHIKALPGFNKISYTLPKRCKKPAIHATSTCPNGEEPKLRFTYIPGTKKCDQFWESGCGKKNINSFANFKECMTVCNPSSKCLKTPTQHRGIIPRITSFVFDINTLNCTTKKSLLKPDIGPQYNRFLKEDDCKKTCEPNLQIIITNSG